MKLKIVGPGVSRRTRKRLSRAELSPALETLAVLHGAGLAYRTVIHPNNHGGVIFDFLIPLLGRLEV